MSRRYLIISIIIVQFVIPLIPISTNLSQVWIEDDFFLVYSKKIELYRNNYIEFSNISLSRATFYYNHTNYSYLLKRDYFTGTFLPNNVANALHIQANLTIDITSLNITQSEIVPDYLNYSGRNTIFWINSNGNIGTNILVGGTEGIVHNITTRLVLSQQREQLLIIVNQTGENAESIYYLYYDKTTLLLTETNKLDRFKRVDTWYSISEQSKLNDTSLSHLRNYLNFVSSKTSKISSNNLNQKSSVNSTSLISFPLLITSLCLVIVRKKIKRDNQ